MGFGGGVKEGKNVPSKCKQGPSRLRALCGSSLSTTLGEPTTPTLVSELQSVASVSRGIAGCGPIDPGQRETRC